MTIDQFLVQFASTVGALVLLLIALTAILLLENRAIAKRLVGPVFALALFLATKAAARLVDLPESSVVREGLRITGLLFFAFALVRIAAILIVDVFLRMRLHHETPKIVRDVIAAWLYLVAFAAVLRLTIHVDLASMFATAGLLSVVIGLALQDTLGNVFSGLAIQVERPFKKGDWVSIGGTTGRIEELGWRATTLVTRDEDLVFVPNSVLTKLEFVNYSRPSPVTARKVEVGLTYETPPSAARTALLASLESGIPGVLREPPPIVRVTSFGDSAVIYQVRFFIDRFQDALEIDSAVHAALWYALRRAGLTIPFPIRTVHSILKADTGDAPSSVAVEAERFLAEVDFLRALDDATRNRLAHRMRAVQFGAGETIVRQGDPGETFFLLAHGEVEVRRRLPTGADAPPVTLQAGAHFGEMSLLTGDPRAATVVATSDCLLLTLGRETFRDALLAHPEVAGTLAEILARREQENVAAAQAARTLTAREPTRILGRLRELFRLDRSA